MHWRSATYHHCPKLTILSRCRRLRVPLFLCCLPGVTWGAVVLESNQTSLGGALRDGGSTIGGGDLKLLPFVSGTSELKLAAVDVALIAVVAGSHQIEFRIYAANSAGDPVTPTPGTLPTPLYTASFTPTLTTTSAWYRLALNYTLAASTPYAFGFVVPGLASTASHADAHSVTWSNTLNSAWPPSGSYGYAGVGTDRSTSGYRWHDSSWVQANASNGFRLYSSSVPEAASSASLLLGLGAMGALHRHRRARQTSRGRA